MGETTQFHWDDVATYGDAKADRRLIAGSGGDLKRVMVKAGTAAGRHAHDFEQFFMVGEGRGLLTCADGEIVLRPGVVIHFAPDAWHEAVFETDTVLYEVNFARVRQGVLFFKKEPKNFCPGGRFPGQRPPGKKLLFVRKK